MLGKITRLGFARPVVLATARSTSAGETDHAKESGALAGAPSGGAATPRSASLEVGFCLRSGGTAIDTSGSDPDSIVMVTASESASVLGAGLETVSVKLYTPTASARGPTSHRHELLLGGASGAQATPPSKVAHAHSNRMPPPHCPVAASHVAVASSGSRD